LTRFPQGRETFFQLAVGTSGLQGLTPGDAEFKSDLSGPNEGRRIIRLSSTMESVSEVEALAEKYATQAGLDEDETFRVAMAVREAAVNAVLHGNEYDPQKEITAILENNGKSLIITICDEGRGVDPSTLPDPTEPENLLRGTGRGVFLIRSLMDEVHFRQMHPGTEVTLIKHLAPPGATT
jgi:serine/threonine-protein kinase RsbW